jgi:hypothetical protein
MQDGIVTPRRRLVFEGPSATGILRFVILRCAIAHRGMTSCREFLGQHEGLARARDIRPVAVEIGDQPFHVGAIDGAIERGLVSELIGRLMHAGIGKAPEPPGLRNAERPRRVGQMLVAVPRVKRGASGGIGDGGTDYEKGCGRWLTSS